MKMMRDSVDRRRFMAGAGVVALATALDPCLAFAQSSDDGRLHQVMDDVFEGDLILAPETATSLGLDKGPRAFLHTRLSDYSLAGDFTAAEHAREMLAEVNAVPAASLSEIWQVRREVVRDMLEQRLVGVPFAVTSVGAPYRISQQDGAYYSIPDFLDSTHPIENAADAEAYLDRLDRFRIALDDQTAAQAADVAKGYVAPGWSLGLAAKQIGALLDGRSAQTSMVGSLARRTAAKRIAGEWAPRATAIVESEVRPALRRQLALLQELRGKTAPGDGVWRLPRGDEIYARALRYSTTTDLSAEQIHQTGLQQVAGLSGQLDTMLLKAGLTKGSVGARLSQFNVRPDQLFANTDAGRAELIASLNAGVKVMQAKLPRAFATVPTQPLEIRRVPPEIQEGAPNGYYAQGALDGSRAAIYWINLKDTGDWPKYSLPALTYHEGIPGHHLHLSLLQQEQDLPMLLKNYFISSYGEGWALYAEMVADELGGYQGFEKAAPCRAGYSGLHGWWSIPVSTPNAGAVSRRPPTWSSTPGSPGGARSARWSAIAAGRARPAATRSARTNGRGCVSARRRSWVRSSTSASSTKSSRKASCRSSCSTSASPRGRRG